MTYEKTILAAMTALFMLAAAAVNAAEVATHLEIYANGSNASVPINNNFFTGVARPEAGAYMLNIATVLWLLILSQLLLPVMQNIL